MPATAAILIGMLRRIPKFFLLLLMTLCAGAASSSRALAPNVTLTPAIVESGSPELIRLHTPDTIVRVEGEWLGRKLEFFPNRDHSAWFALAGVDVEAPAGSSELKITEFTGTGRDALSHDFSTTVPIHPAHYRTSSITVEPKFVEPGPEERKEIEADSKAKQAAFATTADKPLWSGSFLAPVKAQPTDSFGTRRTFNGKLASIHKGTDFRAASGTPVHAGNSGTVILAQHLYFEGNCVMIDHGLGLISISMHLSRIDVKPGQHVSRGQQVGLSGATGRVTGPHLHWAIRWQGAMLDPAKLLRLNLSQVR
ncbi:M23 family metallopeptidase [Acidicapsa acidisoli]|uniref:M23 family metallopeptidase n=1 Tax=Acidicapsa acidisoli TaxID=1615681 RepID=UPI0021E0B5FC|nr:M23 family metallopeptidase [Acidicapsa acidisoli]